MNPGFSTGVPEIDRMLRGILPGDNVVWRVDRVADYAQFLTPYCRYGLASERPAVYFRFAAHSPLIAQGTRGVQVVSLNPSSGFEPFLDAVHDTIEATPKGGYYVFDILSELAAAWYSDQMLCNFFLLTCPYLYDRGDLAYFALLRDRHSNEAVFPIRETCQVMIDVYRRDSEVYLRPIKTQFRHSPTMHLLH
ncbi:MAG: pyruvate phosphate dikinase, partial [Candidatus Hydrogenedentes bacterium]|nr:pyruvate phosphate dikinase [Candidatus Hydrogenedentota bacterium]